MVVLELEKSSLNTLKISGNIWKIGEFFVTLYSNRSMNVQLKKH